MVKKPVSKVFAAVATLAVLSSCLATPLPSTEQSGDGATVETISPEAWTSTYPTPMLTPAVDFADGVSEVPDGHALFVEYQTVVNSRGSCDGILGSDPGMHSFVEGVLPSLAPFMGRRFVAGTLHAPASVASNYPIYLCPHVLGA